MSLTTILLSSAMFLGLTEESVASDHQNWPGFRGTLARGIAEGHELPVKWDVYQGTNVVWKADLPGLSHSSPSIWGDKVFVTSCERDGEAELKVGLYGAGDPVADEGDHAFLLFCLDKATGEVLWEELAFEGTPKVKRHPKSSHSNPSPAVNEDYVVAFFASEGLYCFDHEGDLVWEKDLGVLDAGAPGMRNYQWGFASSPVIHENMLLLQCDVQDQSYVAALDLATGDEIWRTDRDEDPTWGSPTVDIREGRSQVILNGYKHIGAYDLKTGEELWKLVGGGDVPVPTPVVAHDMIYITNAHGRLAPIYAIDAMAKGTVTSEEGDPQMKWRHLKRGNYMQTPLVYGDYLYCCSDAGILACYEAKTGKEVYRKRLGDGTTGFSASGVAGDGKIYFTSEEGFIHVIKAGAEFEVLAVNEMGETCMSTPAISEGTLFLRTRSQLIAVKDDTSGQ